MDDKESKRLQTAANIAVSRRNYRRARDRALARLSKQYPEEYRAYLKEEQERDHREGRDWMDLTGNFNSRNVNRPTGRS